MNKYIQTPLFFVFLFFFWIMNVFWQDPEKVNSMIKDMKMFHMVRYWRGVDYLSLAADFADVQSNEWQGQTYVYQQTEEFHPN